MALEPDIEKLAEEIKSCKNILTALGDESRQHLIIAMMQACNCNGLRVGEITERTNLSRPTVSHNLQILKSCGIVKMRRESTKNYYYFDADMDSFNKLIDMLTHARDIMANLPDRSGKDLSYCYWIW